MVLLNLTKVHFVLKIGVHFNIKTVEFQDKRVKLQIWDHSNGQKWSPTITKNYFNGVLGFILMYDITNEKSFDSLENWLKHIRTHHNKSKTILIGNKCDLKEERVISHNKGKEFADSLNMEFYETSTKDNIEIENAIKGITDSILKSEIFKTVSVLGESIAETVLAIGSGPNAQVPVESNTDKSNINKKEYPIRPMRKSKK